jgi:hypothetical protein
MVSAGRAAREVLKFRGELGNEIVDVVAHARTRKGKSFKLKAGECKKERSSGGG